MEIATTDYHTAGEPFRDRPETACSTLPARRSATGASMPRVRRGGSRASGREEPRGHADMYGGFLVPPDDDGADFGVLFWHKDGYSTACGHGTIALGAWAVESGRVAVSRRRGRRHDRRAFRPCRGDGATPRGRGRQRRLSQRAVVRRGARRRSGRREGRCGLWRRDLRLRARRAPGAAGRAGRPPEPSRRAARSSRPSRGATSRAIPTTIDCRASTGRSSTRSSVRCTSETSRSSPTARSIVRPPGRRPPREPHCLPPTARSPRDRRGATTRSSTRPSTPGDRRARTVCSPRSKGRPSAPASTVFSLDPRDPLGTGFVLR